LSLSSVGVGLVEGDLGGLRPEVSCGDCCCDCAFVSTVSLPAFELSLPPTFVSLATLLSAPVTIGPPCSPRPLGEVGALAITADAATGEDNRTGGGDADLTGDGVGVFSGDDGADDTFPSTAAPSLPSLAGEDGPATLAVASAPAADWSAMAPKVHAESRCGDPLSNESRVSMLTRRSAANNPCCTVRRLAAAPNLCTLLRAEPHNGCRTGRFITAHPGTRVSTGSCRCA
jgi:hypothetical protein